MTADGLIRVSVEDALHRSAAALRRAGAGDDQAVATGRSVVVAEAEGNRAVGLAHLFDYTDALRAGRADGQAEPEIVRDGGVLRANARAGIPHLAFDRAETELREIAAAHGVAVFALSNGFTCGALGYYARRLAADAGLAALVFANAGPAVMPASGGRTPVFCTNPLAFAAPTTHGEIVVDQSSTEAAIVAISQAADAGKPIPEGWALARDGTPTTDPVAALGGSLLAFGGRRGANIALIVELIAAGLTGGAWSADAPAFNDGDRCPGVGMCVIAVDPARTHAGGTGFAEHASRFVETVSADASTHVPGLAKRDAWSDAQRDGVAVNPDTWARVEAAAAG